MQLGSVSSPVLAVGSGADNKRFGAYLSQKERLWWQQFFVDFPNKCNFLHKNKHDTREKERRERGFPESTNSFIYFRRTLFFNTPQADVRRAISTKFCMVIEVVRAIILGPKLFWVPSIVLPLGVVENLAENAPTKVYCL